MPDSDGATTSRRPTEQSTPRAAHQWRVWFVVVPALMGIVLCGAGALLVTPTSDGGFSAYLCVIIGGWAVGFALVNALNAWPERWQWGGHVALAGALVVDAEDRWTVPYPMIQSVIWRSQGDTARFEVHTATRSETFLVGMVRQRNGRASQLPPLMHRMRRVLEESGLRPHERRGTLRYTRSAPTNTVSGSGAPPPALG
ncbi:hypothetical protein Mlaev_00512 [Microbacterium laevaniformans]|uniref:Uncharacterized protein n=1 Tax=Microbacterium laevaniformans TaxID=36807 RepID=A0A150HHY2_9MICO|nr:hypothetical protein [Microbacterium laevaniformans]KXZ61514.1 hypothetical protein Mlaev_00512 [Microbacterium laevaniformans]